MHLHRNQILRTSLGLCLLWWLLVACAAPVARYNNEANDAFEAERYATALEGYRNAQLEAPRLAGPYYNAANSYYRLDEHESALAQAEQALRYSADDEELTQSIFFNKGNIAFQQQDFEAAIEAYKEALRLNPNDLAAKYNLELARQQQQQDEQQQQEQPQESASQDEQEQDEQEQDQQQSSLGGEESEEEREDDSSAQDEQEQEQEQEQTQEPQPDQQNPGDQAQNQPQPQQTQPQPLQTQPQDFTPDQARQLLEAISQDTETLQQRLQQMYVAPGAPPEQDW